MSLQDLLWMINDNEVVYLYDANGENFDTAYGKDGIDDNYMNCAVTDIFTDGGHIAIEIETEV